MRKLRIFPSTLRWYRTHVTIPILPWKIATRSIATGGEGNYHRKTHEPQFIPARRESGTSKTWGIDPYQSLKQLIPALCYFGHTERVVANVYHRVISAVDSNDPHRLEEVRADLYTSAGLVFDLPFATEEEDDTTNNDDTHGPSVLKGSPEILFACISPFYTRNVATMLRTSRRDKVEELVADTLRVFVQLNHEIVPRLDPNRMLTLLGAKTFVEWMADLHLDLRRLNPPGVNELILYATENRKLELLMNIYGSLLDESPPVGNEGQDESGNETAHIAVANVRELRLDTGLGGTNWCLKSLLELAIEFESLPLLVEALYTMPSEPLLKEAAVTILARSPHTGLPLFPWIYDVLPSLRRTFSSASSSHVSPASTQAQPPSESGCVDDRGDHLEAQIIMAVPFDSDEKPPHWSFTKSALVERIYGRYDALQQATRALKLTEEGGKMTAYHIQPKPMRGASLCDLNTPPSLIDPQTALRMQDNVERLSQQLWLAGDSVSQTRSSKDCAAYSSPGGHVYTSISWGNFRFPRSSMSVVSAPGPHKSPSVPYLAFPFPVERIHFVDSPGDVSEMYLHINECDIVGLNVEWGKSVSLLSIATWNNVFLLDLLNLVDTEENYSDMAFDLIRWLFKNPLILKVMYRHSVDMLRLASAFIKSNLVAHAGEVLFDGVESIRNVIDLADHRVLSEAGWKEQQRSKCLGRTSSSWKSRDSEAQDPRRRLLHQLSFESLDQMCDELLGSIAVRPPYAASWESRPLPLPLILSAANQSFVLLMLEAALRKQGHDPIVVLGSPQPYLTL